MAERLSILKKCLIAGFIILVILIQVVVFERYRGIRDLRNWRTEMRAKGEKLDVADFNLPPVPVEGNGVIDLIDAANHLKSLNCLYISAGGPVARYVGPGKCALMVKLENLPPYRFPELFKWKDLEDELLKGTTYLHKARTSVKQPYLQSNSSSSPVTLTVTLGNWFNSSALLYLHRGELEAALADIEFLFLSKRLRAYDPVFYTKIDKIQSTLHDYNTIWQALHITGWNDVQLERIQKLVQSSAGISEMISAFEMECAMIEGRFSSTRQLGSQELGGFWNYSYSNSLKGEIYMNILSQTWLTIWSHQDEFMTSKYAQKYLEVLRSLQKSKSSSSITAFLAHIEGEISLKALSNHRFPLTRQSKDEYTRAILCSIKFESYREMVCTAIALKRYHLKHKTYPHDLSALLPDYLSELPIDWMDGKPLRYKFRKDGTFLLYSVGKNGVDDGGVITGPLGPYSEFIFDDETPDAVWPWPASQKEIDASDLYLQSIGAFNCF
jgi:hypothetical protein